MRARASLLLSIAGALAVLVSLGGCGALFGTYTLLTAGGDGGTPPTGDAGPSDAGPPPDAGPMGPCPDGCLGDERCYVFDDGSSACVKRCVEGYSYNAPIGYTTVNCLDQSPCVFDDGDFLCRDDLQLNVNCGADQPGCLANDTVLFAGCSGGAPIFFECSDRCDPGGGQPACVVDDVPAGWTCAPGLYGAADGCDCGCGVQDPDCIDATADSCVWCTGCVPAGTDCTCGWPNGDCEEAIEPSDNSQCAP